MNLSRRSLLVGAGASAVLLNFPFILRSQPAKRYRTALIGSGWWGMNILTEAMASGECKVVGIADPSMAAMANAATKVSELSGDTPNKYIDFRELLEKEKPEIVVIATPDHWHALTTIAALKAGAHVFVEKPTGHTVIESRSMVNAAKAAGRIVQVGLHRRIGPHHVSGLKFLRDGSVGEIGSVRMFVNSRGGKERPSPNSEPPEGMDWEMYCGPAPLRPFNSKIHPGGWRNFLDFANGTLGDWGVHWVDQVLRWTEEKHPRRIYSTGGRPIQGKSILTKSEQTSDAPDSQIAVFEFESFTATWEHRKFAGPGPEKTGVGCFFYGTKGVFHMGWRDGWTFYPSDNSQNPIHEDSKLQEPDGHNLSLLWKDFMESIKTGSSAIANVESAHRSSSLCFLGMLSLKLGRSLEWDGEREIVRNDPEATKLLKRPYRAPWVYPEG